MSCLGCKRQLEAAKIDVEQLIVEQLALEPVVVSDEVQQKRIVLCEKCPKRSAHTCTSCGCYYRFRAALPNKRCPIGRW